MLTGDQPKLNILLRHLAPIMRDKIDLHSRIFAVEQTSSNKKLNVGALLNIGYQQAMKQYPFTCFVFLSVDAMPTHKKLPLGCEQTPMQLSIPERQKDTPFSQIEALTAEEMRTVNGCPNNFNDLLGA